LIWRVFVCYGWGPPPPPPPAPLQSEFESFLGRFRGHQGSGNPTVPPFLRLMTVLPWEQVCCACFSRKLAVLLPGDFLWPLPFFLWPVSWRTFDNRGCPNLGLLTFFISVLLPRPFSLRSIFALFPSSSHNQRHS